MRAAGVSGDTGEIIKIITFLYLKCRSLTESQGLPGQTGVSGVRLHVQDRVGDPVVVGLSDILIT